MTATILTVGDEILIGQVTDTNATFMANALTDAGIDVLEHLTVADSREGIMGGIERALEQSELVLMTGGLGPTKDDITKIVLADYFGTDLVFHEPTYKRLTKLLKGFGRKPNASHRQQCHLPATATILDNQRGTAPGMWFEHDGKILVSMPGVPYEMRELVRSEVLPRVAEADASDIRKRTLTLLTAGAGESTIAELIAEQEDGLPENMSLAYLPNLGTVRLRLTARGEDPEALQTQLKEEAAKITAVLGKLVFGEGSDDLALVLARDLQDNKLTLATAESCTGGALGAAITRHPGSSGHYVGGVVAYSNELKRKLLGVRATTLKKHGAVSEETVIAMAEGARKKLGADYALATSGVAGPGGGSKEKPVGTIWIAVAGPEGTVAKLLKAGKDRKRNITYTVFAALNLLRKHRNISYPCLTCR